MKKIILVIVALGLLAGGAYRLWSNRTTTPPPAEHEVVSGAPTDFARAGVVAFHTPGLEEGVPHLIYEEPGAPALTKKLVLDELSTCQYLPCMAQSISLDVQFDGQRATVEGVLQEDGSVLVRKMATIGKTDPSPYLELGRTYIPWMQAVRLIESCGVSMIMQTHALDVHLTLPDGKKMVAVEPAIDEVFGVYHRAKESCGDLPIATE